MLAWRQMLAGMALGAGLVLAGCTTVSTVETRKQERSAAYADLTPQERAEVDRGRIKVGMGMDAVYIAWGKPSQILPGETSQGPTVTWIYLGTYLDEHRFWTYSYYGWGYGYHYYCAPYLAYDYHPQTYVRAEVRFQNGKVTEWRSLPRPY